MITGDWAVTVVSLKALSESLRVSQCWMLDLPQISVNNATFKLFGVLLTDTAEYNDHKWLFWKKNALLPLAPCFWTWIRHLIPFLRNGFCRDDPCTVSLVSGKKGGKKARLKHLFRFKAHWLADKPKQRGPHRVREREQMQEIEEAQSDKKDT